MRKGMIAINLRQASLKDDDLKMAEDIVRAVARDESDENVKQVIEQLAVVLAHGISCRMKLAISRSPSGVSTLSG